MQVRTGSLWQIRSEVDRLYDAHECAECLADSVDAACWFQTHARTLRDLLQDDADDATLLVFHREVEATSTDALLALAERGASDEALDLRDDETWALLTLAEAAAQG